MFPVFVNGSSGGQVYLTSPTSPHQPQAPQTVTGDMTMNAQGVTSIKPGAVTLNKLAATGTPDRSKYLRGDNTWSTAQGLISTNVFNGQVGNIAPKSSSYVFAGNTVVITLTETKRVTASAVTALGFSAGGSNNQIRIDICYQPVSGGTLNNFTGWEYVEHHMSEVMQPYSAIGSISLTAGTYRIGLGIFNPSNYTINDTRFYMNGWVMVY